MLEIYTPFLGVNNKQDMKRTSFFVGANRVNWISYYICFALWNKVCISTVSHLDSTFKFMRLH